MYPGCNRRRIYHLTKAQELRARSENVDEMGLFQLFDEMLRIERAAFDNVTLVEKMLFKALGFGKAFTLVDEAIGEVGDWQQMFTQFEQQQIPLEQFQREFTESIRRSNARNREFVPVVAYSAVFVKNALMLLTGIFLTRLVCNSTLVWV